MPSRIVKKLMRRAMVSWRERPTQHDIEALQANTRRVGLVIRVRWALVVVLTVFSVMAGWAYALTGLGDILLRNMVVPAVALVFVLLYNTYYQVTYKRLGNIAFLNHAQLMFDVLVVSVLVYYSGGIYSWFPAMYLLFILEAAFILPQRRDVWLIALVSAGVYGALVWAEYYGVVAHVAVPFVTNELQWNRTYVGVHYMWQLTVMLGTATVVNLMMAAVRSRERELAESVVVDATTGLFNRAYCQRLLQAEVERARTEGRSVAVVMADVDDFMEFNRLFGIDGGDAMLRRVGAELEKTARASAEASGRTATVCRFGGEEFVAVLPGVEVPAEVAETARAAIERLLVGEASVTVSLGIAVFPEHGSTPDDLLANADAALSAAKAAGGNRVVVAESEQPAGAADFAHAG